MPSAPPTDPTPRPHTPPVHLQVAVVVAATATTSVRGRQTRLHHLHPRGRPHAVRSPHRSDPSTTHAARPPTSGGGGGGDSDDFGVWATNAPPPLGPPDRRIEGKLPRAHRCADADRARCAHAKVLKPPIVHAATRPDTADTAAAPDTQDLQNNLQAHHLQLAQATLTPLMTRKAPPTRRGPVRPVH
jgi:hypothetical protein